jgi:transposase
MALEVRPPTAEEDAELRRRAASRTLPARVVQRAKMTRLLHEGERVRTVAERLGVGADVVRGWLKRSNAAGLEGLKDRPRSGRPATYTPEQVGAVVEASLTRPAALGLPFASWTLDRLAAYLQEVKGIPIRRTRIDEILAAEGLRWRARETWFGERVDPAFAEKRHLSVSSRATRGGRPRVAGLQPRYARGAVASLGPVEETARASRRSCR